MSTSNIFSIPCFICHKQIVIKTDQIINYKLFIEFRDKEKSFEICVKCNNDLTKDQKDKIILSNDRSNRLHDLHNEINLMSFGIKESYNQKELLKLTSDLLFSLSNLDSLGVHKNIIKSIHEKTKSLFELTKEIKKDIYKQQKEIDTSKDYSKELRF